MFFAACLSSGSDFGLVTAFDIKADVLVSLALIASVCIGDHFAAGEAAVIMQLGALPEELTVVRNANWYI